MKNRWKSEERRSPLRRVEEIHFHSWIDRWRANGAARYIFIAGLREPERPQGAVARKASKYTVSHGDTVIP